MSFKLNWLYSNIVLICICYLRFIWAVPEKSEEADTFEKECKDLKVHGESTTSDATRTEKYLGCLPYITGTFKGSDPYIPQMDTFYLLEPPPDVPKTLVKVTKLEMGNFHVLGESDFRPDIELEIKITWSDSRLKWDKNEWGFDTYPIELKPLSSIWGPKFNQKSSSQVDLLFELFSYYEPVVTYTGNVTATLGAQLVFTKCKIDVSKFPYDDIKCCTDFSINAHDNKVILETDGAQLEWDTTTGGIWEVLFLTVEVKQTEAINGAKPLELMDFCVVARRNTNVLGMELSMPMGVSAIVMMCAQLTGKWKMQVYVKMFALFLQVFSFQTLIPNEAMSVATKLPRIYQFYNFTVGITIFSLIQTMIFWALSRRWFIMPPPHKMVLGMKAISRCMLGDSKQTTAEADTGNVENLSKSASNGYRKEWEVIFATIHAILSVIIILAYVIGVIIIYAG